MTKTKHKTSRRGRSTSNHSWIWALVIILIIAALVAVVVFVFRPQPASVPSTNPDTPAAETPSTPDPDPATESPVVSAGSETPDTKAPQYEGTDPNTLAELTGVIISKDVSAGTLSVMTMINQYLHQTGICVITLTGRNSRNFYTASADAHADISTSYCETFNIPVANLASDTYDLEIQLTGDGKTGTIRDEVSL